MMLAARNSSSTGTGASVASPPASYAAIVNRHSSKRANYRPPNEANERQQQQQQQYGAASLIRPQSESVNTSSASSSGYTSQNGAFNHHNYAAHQYHFHAENLSPMATNEPPPQADRVPSASLDHHQHQERLQRLRRQQQQLVAGVHRAPLSMMPMMIDDDDGFDIDGADLIDDDIGADDDDNNNNNIGADADEEAEVGADGDHNNNNNNFTSFNGHLVQHHHHLGGECVDSDGERLAVVGLHKPPIDWQLGQDRYALASMHQRAASDFSRNGAHHLPPSQRLAAMPAAGQMTTTAARDQRLYTNSSSFSSHKKYPQFANHNHNHHHPHQLATVYHQPILSGQYSGHRNTQQQQQHIHSFSYLHPEAHAQFSHQHQYSLEQHQQHQTAADRSYGSKTNGGPPIGQSLVLASGTKRREQAASTKMQGSRQNLAAPETQHRTHHHQLAGSKRAKGEGKASSRKHAPSKSAGAGSAPNGNGGSGSGSDGANTGKPALDWCGKLAKLFLFITNILFWSAGIALGAWGILSLVEDHKYNLSQLLVFEPNSRMSLFQLLSWSFITLGCATILVGFCGCSAVLKNNRWILGLYIFLILAIFALDLATGLLAIIFQERLVANVRLRLVNKLRSEYGVQASFTAAIDYIQTRFECCGLEGHFDYDQSLWRLQRLGGFEATVARTCCHLRNSLDDQAHINPRPVNESMCQSTDVRFHQSYRYRKGCLDDLERLVRQKIWTFTLGCGAVGAVILLSLVFATCFCRSIPGHSSRKSSADRELQQQSNHQPDKKHHPHPHLQTAQQQGQAALESQPRHYR